MRKDAKVQKITTNRLTIYGFIILLVLAFADFLFLGGRPPEIINRLLFATSIGFNIFCFFTIMDLTKNRRE